MPLSLCFVTAELAPYAKAGGLADVSAALTRQLHRRGHDLRVFLPLYAGLERRGLQPEAMDGLGGLQLQLGSHRFDYSVLRASRRPDQPELLLIDCPELFSRAGIYGTAADEHLRFVLLSLAALDACARIGFAPDIVHCHDWHTALIPDYLRQRRREAVFAASRSVLTIHNLGYQGSFPASVIGELGLGGAAEAVSQQAAASGQVSLLRRGIVSADAVNTVSPTYAREICTPAMGMGLDEDLRARNQPVVGILNGVDTDVWDPASDRLIPWHYSAADLQGKRRMRMALCERLGLQPDDSCPLVGMVSRLVWQKGVDLLFDVLPELLLQRELSLAVLGNGDPDYERFFRQLAVVHPGRVAFQRGFDVELSHWIEAGCDAFLMPSRYEPCGLNQMYSMRYGTVPVVRRTGGLADSVTPFQPASGTGTGIVFNDADAGAVRWALTELGRLFRQPRPWRHLMQNGMARDCSWEPAVDRYLDLYAQALAVPVG